MQDCYIIIHKIDRNYNKNQVSYAYGNDFPSPNSVGHGKASLLPPPPLFVVPTSRCPTIV